MKDALSAVVWVMWIVHMTTMAVTKMLDAGSFSEAIITAAAFLLAGFVIPAAILSLK